MKAKLKYFFARLIVLLVALHTLDTSIDFDHVSSRATAYAKESFDDIDSFSEFIIEKIFDDDNLFAEGDRDDHNPHDKQSLKHAVVYVHFRKEMKAVVITAPAQPAPTYIIRNVQFETEDHSHADLIPPDFSAC